MLSYILVPSILYLIKIKIFFNKLEEAAKIYDALSDVDNIIWRDKPECCEYIEELKILDNNRLLIFKYLS